ncbi:MAG: RNA polymerase sigma factor [Prevotella sp.]
MEDRTLIDSIRKGDTRLFREVMRRYTPLIYNKALGITHDEETAREATQQCFIKAYDRLDCWNGKQLGPWLSAIAMHTALDIISKRKRRRESSIEDDKRVRQVAETEYSDERERQLQRLEDAVGQLPENDRMLIEMHYYQSVKTEEIARRTGMTQTNILVKLHRIREKIKKTIAGQQ